MTTIRTTCPTDGEVDLTELDVVISPDRSSYSFICPRCLDDVRKSADLKIIGLLASAGVHLPPPPSENAFTENDVDMFAANIDEELRRLLT